MIRRTLVAASSIAFFTLLAVAPALNWGSAAAKVTDPLPTASTSPALESALSTIQAEDVRSHVEVLADDSFEGREAGSRGGHAAAKYLAMFFQKYDLQPAGEGESYFQGFGSGYRNILGMIPGSDPTLSDEVVVIGAHYDHVGMGSRRNSFGPYGVVHNGADDNASGTSALLELIEAFADMPERPARSILFCLWDGEEMGLLGSKHWLGEPTIDAKRIVFSINLDMVGRLRDEGLSVYGDRTAVGLRQFLTGANVDQIKLSFNWDIKPDSDHHPFIMRGVPTVMMHTGLHDQYHRPTDDIDTLNYEGVEQVTRYVAQVAWDVANREERFEFRAESRGESEADRVKFERAARAFPTRLGIEIESSKAAGGGLLIRDVLAGSAADRAGLRAGMRIEGLNQEAVTDAATFWDAIFDADDEVVVTTRGQGQEPTAYRVKLDGQPLRVGVSWREDEADPHLVLVTRVCPNSRADRAGLVAGARLYRVDGDLIESQGWLSQRLRNATGDLVIDFEIEGHLRQATLKFAAESEVSDEALSLNSNSALN